MNTDSNHELLERSKGGDIDAFQTLFAEFQNQLKSYLYRLTTDRNDAEDFTHDTFIKAFNKLSTFRGESTLKTWVFQIATNLAYNSLAHKKRWSVNVTEEAKKLVMSTKSLSDSIVSVHNHSPQAIFEIKEHIDTCFTCVSKNLPIEKQVALLLKDIYDFSIKEISMILERPEGSVKYLISEGRATLTDVFDSRCPLVNKQGVCHQCSELNGWFNPKQDQQEALNAIDMKRDSGKYNRNELYNLRAKLVKAIDPLRSKGNELQDILMKCNRMAMGEVSL